MMERELKSIPEFAAKLFAIQDQAATLKAIGAAVAAGLAFTFPDEAHRKMALWVVVLVLVDTITGITAAFIEDKPRTSLGFRRILGKLIAYFGSVILAIAMDDTLLIQWPFCTSIVLGLMLGSEAYSILENINKLGFKRLGFLKKIIGRTLEANTKAFTDAFAQKEEGKEHEIKG